MVRGKMRGIARWAAVFVFGIVCGLAAIPARAQAPHDGGDTVTISLLNGPNFTYGDKPSFKVVVTLAAPPSGNRSPAAYVEFEDGSHISDVESRTNNDSTVLTYTHLATQSVLSVGQHTVTAHWANYDTDITTYSAPLTFTIGKATLSIDCGYVIANDTYQPLPAGQPITVRMTHPTVGGEGTYTLTFDGPSHVTYSNLTVDSNGDVQVMAPTKGGYYSLNCTFSGNDYYNGGASDNPQVRLFSYLHSLGTVQLFTSPTTVVANQKLVFNVVFHAAPGGPLPTGDFSFYIGDDYYTPSMKMNASANMLVQVGPFPSVKSVQNIWVDFQGDAYYDEALIKFPVTNPPIPAGAGGGSTGSSGGSGGTNGPQATTTAQATASAQATSPANVLTPGEDTGNATQPQTTGQMGQNDNSGFLLAGGGMLGVLLVGGGVGALLYRARRRKVAAGGSSSTSDTLVDS